jgi:DNA-binding SARP family transcriptional activator
LAVLGLAGGRVVGVEELIDALWGRTWDVYL